MGSSDEQKDSCYCHQPFFGEVSRLLLIGNLYSTGVSCKRHNCHEIGRISEGALYKCVNEQLHKAQ